MAQGADRETSSAGRYAGITPIDHAADVGIEIRANSLTELFSRAATGMTGLLLAEQAVNRSAGPATRHEIEVDAPDAATLLVAWLRELLHLHNTGGFSFLEADFLELRDQHLHAHVDGVTQHAAGGREIKGVTYHGLDVSEREGEWRARVIFDV